MFYYFSVNKLLNINNKYFTNYFEQYNFPLFVIQFLNLYLCVFTGYVNKYKSK